MPIRDQYRGGVAVAMAVPPGGSDQPTDLAIGEVLARAALGIALAARWARAKINCPNNGCRRHQREMRFCHDFSGLSACYCPKYELSRDTAQGRNADLMGTTAILGAGGEPVGMLETLNWRAFCRRAQPTPPPAMTSRGRQMEEKYCKAGADQPASFF